MKSNELRLGNYVKYKGAHAVVTPNVILAIFNGSANYTPIELSPEILEKCGFRSTRKVEFTKVFDEETGAVIIVNNINGTYSLSCFAVEFNYLHELQNIYFCLCKTELTIQL
jgi:hypothetical protein